ncbi:MAG: hypothetical protein IT223_06545, partial [Crocinitomicaceae bacterium]|nr:hypothetical protein [Crocinitomicaceae bacterium]
MVTTSTHTKDRNIAAFGTLLVHTAVILLAVLFLKNCSGGGGGGNGGFGNGLMSLEVAGLG